MPLKNIISLKRAVETDYRGQRSNNYTSRRPSQYTLQHDRNCSTSCQQQGSWIQDNNMKCNGLHTRQLMLRQFLVTPQSQFWWQASVIMTFGRRLLAKNFIDAGESLLQTDSNLVIMVSSSSTESPFSKKKVDWLVVNKQIAEWQRKWAGDNIDKFWRDKASVLLQNEAIVAAAKGC